MVILVVWGAAAPALSQDCAWSFPVGVAPDSPSPLSNNHAVGGLNLPSFGTHLGGDYWSGSSCTDLGRPVFAIADGFVAEIADSLGSYLDVVVIRHEDPDLGTVYSMYGHIARDGALRKGDPVSRRQQIGTIANVLAYFSPCQLHFEVMSQEAFESGPFCTGCEAAGIRVSPGYDQMRGVLSGTVPSGDTYLEVVDSIAGNRWYHTDEVIGRRLGRTCGPLDTNDYELVDSTVPAQVDIRDPESGRVELVLRNRGTRAWIHDDVFPPVDALEKYRLAVASDNQLLLGPTDASSGYCVAVDDCRRYLSRDVAPGATVAISFLLQPTASQVGSTERLSFRMVSEGYELFGPTHAFDVAVCDGCGVIGASDAAVPTGDAGTPSDAGTVTGDAGAFTNPDSGTAPRTDLGGGCSCRAASPNKAPLWLPVLFVLGLCRRGNERRNA